MPWGFGSRNLTSTHHMAETTVKQALTSTKNTNAVSPRSRRIDAHNTASPAKSHSEQVHLQQGTMPPARAQREPGTKIARTTKIMMCATLTLNLPTPNPKPCAAAHIHVMVPELYERYSHMENKTIVATETTVTADIPAAQSSIMSDCQQRSRMRTTVHCHRIPDCTCRSDSAAAYFASSFSL